MCGGPRSSSGPWATLTVPLNTLVPIKAKPRLLEQTSHES